MKRRQSRSKLPEDAGPVGTEGSSRAALETFETIETVAIPPSPRILKLIAEIEFRPWQCLAELIDNSFDEFLAMRRAGLSRSGPLDVSVTLPSQREPLDQASIVVSDNGRGMTLEHATDAVRAGYTSRDPIANLGLFGMGFNVATARLGGVTRFMTTREGDPEWIGVQIDVDNMAEGFKAPLVRAPKTSPDDHGTRVEIGRLRRIAEPLTRPVNQTNLRKQFGGIYSYLLDAEEFRLTVNGIAVQPWRHCVWSKERSVVTGGEQIPAVIEIDEDLGERAVCKACGLWQYPFNTECEQCASPDLETRQRRVHGWVGISRELDRKEFGLDFLRNGRKILRFDKEIFRWDDPDEPTGTGEIEYPIELPANAGRIVGEIHLDHVRVAYTKNSFDTADAAWWAAIKILRGEGPLLPRKARALNYGRNDSPLARLHRGYRRNDPGKAYLIPGIGTKQRARRDTTEWVKRFHDGDSEYQDDTKWWEAIEEHEAALAAKQAGEVAKSDADREDEDPTSEFRDHGDNQGGSQSSQEAAADHGTDEQLTDEQRVERLLLASVPLPQLNGEFVATGVGTRAMKLRAYASRGHPLFVDGRRVPVWTTGQKGGGFVAFVDLDHPHFRVFDDEPEDVLVMEIAQSLITRAPRGTTTPIGAVYTELKEKHLSANAIDPGRLIPEAGSLMHDIQERMVACVQDNPERPWLALVEAERHATQERITEMLKTADIESVVFSGEYMRYLPPSVVPRLVEEWPEAFLDGRLFSAPFDELKTPGAKRGMVATISGYLSDIAWLAGNPVAAPRDRMIRARLSLKLLPEELL
jgi:Histidine kinase-, DNA gyrase B-, and HSP90-like ATPase